VPLVPGPSLITFILESDIRNFKELDRLRLILVPCQSLEYTWNQGGADNLVFNGLGVGKFNSSFTVILTVKILEVLIVRALIPTWCEIRIEEVQDNNKNI
jgi:hypothetical protein